MEKTNYAFIDAQNLNAGLNKLGWKIDWKKFRTYLSEERNVEIAYVFIGFMLGNQDLYLVLQKAGFVVVFKEVFTTQTGDVKGNIDAELILQAMIDYDRYDKALIVSGDGDFTCLLRYLSQNNKFEGVIAPYEKSLSSLVQRAADGKIENLRSLRKKLEYRHGPHQKKAGPKPERVAFVPEELKEKPAPVVPELQKIQSTHKPKHPSPNIRKPSKHQILPELRDTPRAKHAPHIPRTPVERVKSPGPKVDQKKGDDRYDGFWEL